MQQYGNYNKTAKLRWWWIVFVVWLTDKRRLFLFPAGTIVRDPHHRESPTRWAGFEPAQNLSSGLVEWSCAVVITTTPRRHKNKTKWNLFSTYFNSYYSMNPSHRCRIWKRPTKVSKNQYVVTLLSLIFIFWTPCSCLPYVSYCCTNDSHIFGHIPSEKC